jgi:hypothetical protein
MARDCWLNARNRVSNPTKALSTWRASAVRQRDDLKTAPRSPSPGLDITPRIDFSGNNHYERADLLATKSQHDIEPG